ncbi:MAG: sensor histidine kinase N-terminal domain-containing protein [Candidatus Accumulibacter sp.]|jgi:two-component system sensor histidine kinase TctE|nr:sensor histidine kinase N-terminal domain-containing protein [Accumulibacter sp.]
MLPSLVLILLMTAVWSYRNAMDAVDHAYDRSLTKAIRAIAENIHVSNGRILANIPYSAMDLIDEDVQERIYYAILGPDGATLTGYRDLVPPLEADPPSDVPLMVNAHFREHDIRMGILGKRLYAPELPGSDTVTILFAETMEARTQLAWRLFLDNLMWQILLVAAVVVILSFALSRTFHPLLALRESIRQRGAEDLTPVPLTAVPTEVRPLIDAINSHMSRLAQMLKTRRRFLADAAHQIRTPLAVLGTQAEYGERQSDPEEMRRTFEGMLNSIRVTRHMVNQMLILARAESADGLIQERAAFDVAELAREVAGDFAILALEKNIELAFEAPDSPLCMNGSATMFREMISNVVDNALRYTPANGHVTLSLARTASIPPRMRLCVTDDGPGIPVAERDKVFRRFYRILGSGDSAGSGLGLCIAREICKAHGGAIRLCDVPGGRGLAVEIVFPSQDAAPNFELYARRTSD